ncbi:response regulator [Ktedonosporobacter rubrisoli]|uniref:Response regulator n=1 Tax=Ktedonosporobacter rubrisoli TaxID=2509675 RepID=A0A4P6JUQ3_KTERU|nr:response regulator [Ktedonosporobacter rubrisoli]QBD79040.1 response regulator [Ktedonosporobacter rubrisoli]
MEETSKLARILVVEDDPAIQQVICFFLEHNDFEVRQASDGQEAIAVISEFKPHLIILDLIMRPVSGWDVLHWLRANPLSPQPPVLVLSALVHLTEQMQGFEEGAIEYMTKPTQPSMIVERVRAILSLNAEQRLMLQHKRMDEQRKVLERLQATQRDEFVY